MALTSLLSSESGASETDEGPVVTTEREGATAERESSLAEERAFRVGRVLFGGVLAFMAVDNFRNLEQRIGYAQSKGAPRPETSVPAISASLLAGGIGVALWRLPAAAASAVAAFFVSVTPVVHDFWALDDPEERQSQMVHFLKNAALLGGSLVLVAVGRRETERPVATTEPSSDAETRS